MSIGGAAGAIGAVVPAYAPILAYILGDAHSLRQMTLIALGSEAIPVLALLAIDQLWTSIHFDLRYLL